MKQSVQHEKYNNFEIELAKRILCSTVSTQMGISYQHCWKTYIEPNLKEKEVGALYLECVRFIRQNIHNKQQAIFSGSIS
jgi:hypothetical protein